MAGLRARFQARRRSARGHARRPRRSRRHRRHRRSLSAVGVSRRDRPRRRRGWKTCCLTASMAFNAFGPRNEHFEASMRDAARGRRLDQRAMRARGAGAGRARRRRLGGRRQRRDHRRRGAAAGALAADGGARHHDHRHRQRALRAGRESRGMAASCATTPRWCAPPSTRCCASNRRCRPSSAPRRAPTELGGVALPKDAKILLFLAGANRDPRRWDDARPLRRDAQGAGPRRVRRRHPHVRRPDAGAARNRDDPDGAAEALLRPSRSPANRAQAQQHAAPIRAPARCD